MRLRRLGRLYLAARDRMLAARNYGDTDGYQVARAEAARLRRAIVKG